MKNEKNHDLHKVKIANSLANPRALLGSVVMYIGKVKVNVRPKLDVLRVFFGVGRGVEDFAGAAGARGCAGRPPKNLKDH